jgi:inhibitor of KinA sporulation pathway (predicted exonuclease)
MYPEEMVKPMRAELTDAGFQELYSSEAVENALKNEGLEFEGTRHRGISDAINTAKLLKLLI